VDEVFVPIDNSNISKRYFAPLEMPKWMLARILAFFQWGFIGSGGS
jgi:hypothetical protein